MEIASLSSPKITMKNTETAATRYPCKVDCIDPVPARRFWRLLLIRVERAEGIVVLLAIVEVLMSMAWSEIALHRYSSDSSDAGIHGTTRMQIDVSAVDRLHTTITYR